MTRSDSTNKELLGAVQDQDPRDLLSRCRFPSPEQHKERVVSPLKRVNIRSEQEKALEISQWMDRESLGTGAE
jgi:hypothetical protein